MHYRLLYFFQALVRWLPSLQPEQVNVVFTGKDNPNIGLVNIISYDLMAKKVNEIQKVRYNVVIVVSSGTAAVSDYGFENLKFGKATILLRICSV